MPAAMRSGKIYFRKGCYLVHPMAGSGGREPSLFSEPVVKLSQDVTATKLGEAVMEALKLSRLDAPWPTDWKGFIKPLHDAAGVNSESAFRKGLLSVRVDLVGTTVKVAPTTSKGPHKGSEPIVEKIIQIELTDAASLGAAVLQAIALSD